MATIKYLIKSKNELSTIYVRLRDGRQTDISVSTGYTIDPKFWSDAKGTVKQSAGNNEKLNMANSLEGLQRKIADSLNADKGNGVDISKEWLETVILKYKNPHLEQKNDFLIDLIESYQSEMKTKINQKTGKRIAPTTIRNFGTTISHLKDFEAYKKKKYTIHEIDLTFLADFMKYERANLNLAQNTISKDVRQIKTVCLDARDKGFSINRQVESRKFNAPSESTDFVTITEEEIEKIKTFKGVDYLENARDWLIIGCWTGCRVSDLMQLTKNNILTTPKGQKFIRYTQSKTGKQVDIPVHSDIIEILDRLGDFPRPISDQRFNEWIKKVCEQAGLTDEVKGTRQNPETHLQEKGIFQKWQLIRSHTCRRSFATNHYNKLSNKLIMAVTGHSTEKMLLNYIGETENAHIDDFINVWNKVSENKEDIIQMEKQSV